MDGNNRWSIKNSKTKFDAYSKGAQKLISISEYIFKNSNVRYISAFALSNNNLYRAKSIINILKNILSDYLDDEKNISRLNFQIIFFGDLSFLGKKLNDKIKKLEKFKKNRKKKLLIFLNYSGRKDIKMQYTQRNIISNYENNSFNKNLATNNIPDPEILIRTGGYQRISDFMLYQIAFTELFFLKKLWPDISNNDVKKIISNFKLIKRKFGL